MRNTIVIGGMCLLLILLGAWMYYHAGPSQTPEMVQAQNTANANAALPQKTEVSFTNIATGTAAVSMASRKNYAIYDATDFATFWKKAKGAAAKVPAVDFKKDYVIAVFAGTKPTGGYAITVAGVEDTQTARNVSVVITGPGKGCVVSQAKTSPYEFITVPLEGAEALAHTDAQKTKDCE